MNEKDTVFVALDKLRLHDGDIVVTRTADGSPQGESILAIGYIHEWAEKRQICIADKIIYMGGGHISRMSEAEMNAAGWYRK